MNKKNEFVIINGSKIYKVVKPYYSDKTGVIYATCPYCGGDVQRIWNLCNCGNCGGKISWKDVNVENYHAI